MNKFTVLFLIFLSAARAADLSFTVPSGYQNALGNGVSHYPFSILGATNSARYQQAYDASAFASIPNGGLITEIDFRVDEHYGGFVATLPDIQINLSTTAKGPDSLSPVFSANIGSDERVVVGRGQLPLSSQGSLGLIDIRIVFATPFLYSPSAGNLLMES